MITITDGTTILSFSPPPIHTSGVNTPRAYGEDAVTLGFRLVSTRFEMSTGTKHVFEAKLENGKLKGRFYWSDALQCRIWADSMTTLTVNINGDIFSGRIPLDGVDILPVTPKNNQPLTSACYGTLTMIED